MTTLLTASPTAGEIRTALVDLLSLARNSRDAAGNPFGDPPHWAIRAAEAVLVRLGR